MRAARRNGVSTNGSLTFLRSLENPCVQENDSQIWGQGFDAPVFANEFRVVRQSLVKDAHTKLILELGGQRFDAIFFRHTETLPGMVRLAYRPNINEFMGRRSVQLVIEAAEL